MPLTADQTRGFYFPSGRAKTACLFVLLVLSGLWVLVAPAEAADLRVVLGDGRYALMTEQKEMFLEASPERGDGLIAFTSRYCGSSAPRAEVARVNGNPRRLLRTSRYRIPFELLTPEYQLLVIRSIFREDGTQASGWQHQVRDFRGSDRESLWQIAVWFTGRGENYRVIRDRNGLADDDLSPGQRILVPAEVLRPALRAALPAASPYRLEYGADEQGEYAVYRLKGGEALYSSVVVRFTGRVFADDVNALAGDIARRSGIRDVTDIPIGYRVKIPVELLLPEYLPASDPRRKEYEKGLLAASRFSNQVTARSLEGVTVVLDAGHGGASVGASIGNVWESTYVYDIMVRAKRLLETTTGATVIATTQEGSSFTVPDQDKLAKSKNHRVLTTPNYQIEDSTVGVHLRWYLANSVYRQALDRGNDPAKVVFISIHADSLHPTLRGAMVYIPGASYRTGSYGKTGSVYASRREYNEKPRVSYSQSERVRSEGLSRDLAEHLLRAFEASDLAVHDYKPIREKVIRSRRAWVPAVIRYNAIPSKVLLEVCNLNNSADRKLIETRRFRQDVAESIVQGILAYYEPGAPGSRGTSRVATTSP